MLDGYEWILKDFRLLGIISSSTNENLTQRALTVKHLLVDFPRKQFKI